MKLFYQHNFLKKIISTGAQGAGPRSKIRSIQLTNAIALISATLFIVLVAYLTLRDGLTIAALIGLCTIGILLSIIVLNRFRFYNIARGLICIIIPLSVLTAIFLPRIPLIGQYNHFRSPELYSILITSSVIPLLIFSLREKKALWAGLVINVLILLSFDYILYRFSSSNAQAPYTLLRFVGSHFVILIMYLFLAGSIAFLRDLFEYFEAKNERLIAQLHNKNEALSISNQELQELNQEIEVQNEEIKSQSEELLQTQESILLANIEIERQKNELEQKNLLLEASLDEKNLDLLKTNQQLISQNSDLQQFSFTVSHNLKAPVASIKGLIYLYHLSKTEEERANLFKLFEESTVSLDTIVRDLGKIVDIRHDNFIPLEKVSLQTEVDLITQSLNSFIQSNEVSIETNFSVPQIVSIKPYINSILFNLISNAIQYRSDMRKAVIQVSSRLTDEFVVVEVIDNGLGIDLRKHKADLFKLYKRFHSHTPGKGLGLFLVKQQVDKLNAKIEVESSPDQGTTFRIFLQKNA